MKIKKILNELTNGLSHVFEGFTLGDQVVYIKTDGRVVFKNKTTRRDLITLSVSKHKVPTSRSLITTDEKFSLEQFVYSKLSDGSSERTCRVELVLNFLGLLPTSSLLTDCCDLDYSMSTDGSYNDCSLTVSLTLGDSRLTYVLYFEDLSSLLVSGKN